MDYFYTIDKSGLIVIWKWVDDYLSEQYKHQKNFNQFKKGQKINLQLQENEEEEQEYINESQYLTEFENKVEKGRFIQQKKEIFKGGRLKSCEYHIQTQTIILGFKTGSYSLYRLETPESLTEIQTFGITNSRINTLAVNPSGSWIAMGINKIGQLLVWEWRSQTYILDQQCLSNDCNVVTYSEDCLTIASGGMDGKVRLWDAKTHFCFSTFNEHDSKVTGITFTSRANTVITSSLDGTCRAFDTLRYKCFRVLKPNINTQLNCVAVDQSGELVCAGAIDPYNIYLWNLQTGNLLETISGHEAPISCLKFYGERLFSGSWDKNLRMHEIYTRKLNSEVLSHNAEITALDIRRDGKEYCVATIKGEIYLWNSENNSVVGILDCKRDLEYGRNDNDRTKNTYKYFKSISYSIDGDYILAGGNSKFVCLYELRHRIMIRKFSISNNRSLDGVLNKLNSKFIKEGVDIQNEIDDFDDSDYEQRKDHVLPGAKNFDVSKRTMKQQVESRCISFSPSEDNWVCATSEGVLVFGQAINKYFNPYELDENITVGNVMKAFEEKQYSKGIIIALQLNNKELLEQAYLNIPYNKYSLSVKLFLKYIWKIQFYLQVIYQKKIKKFNIILCGLNLFYLSMNIF
ncbi:periodic tryptophan protein 2, putative [Ichthyophthirius multifiliis]|uniref:Periodic tryptophan protein 2, putative n=1 Tax=Ichthyophthirius multifiliis TaxID=5932 RepID=G0R198_ICHMU|nr:periodic tryptophan protein 2, putative [Ichthyophthirius multifiliis]EGR28731.1 periodic tryptophan protein 2, putative [Ichthyophthirius multifiliis]|eukprot:XP_004029967.1 periodic tryptophan protein 2, putative [Ichthyophthirius multifiliis]